MSHWALECVLSLYLPQSLLHSPLNIKETGTKSHFILCFLTAALIKCVGRVYGWKLKLTAIQFGGIWRRIIKGKNYLDGWSGNCALIKLVMICLTKYSHLTTIVNILPTYLANRKWFMKFACFVENKNPSQGLPSVCL